MDLISRKAVRDGMMKYGFVAPDMTVHEFVEDELPSIPAVPLDRLCDMLGKSETFIPCNLCEYEVNGHQKCTKETKCPCEADDWKRALTKWMEEQHESD